MPIEVRSLSKRFGDVHALRGIDLRVGDGEFVTLLGPSGCGKTTLLRIIGGFEAPTAGQVLCDGVDITREPSHRRPVNTVFQRPVLLPHLNVFENVAFGLRVQRRPKREVRERVLEALSLVRLEGYEKRAADELSGGQAQRVSLARALVNRPRLLLLDEPLSALDLKVRVEMQTELRRIHRQTGATFLYVTHDQQEAMSLSDAVVVMDHGIVEQIGPPSDVYHRPASPFVAGFVGDANLLSCDVVGDDVVQLDSGRHLITVRVPAGSQAGFLVLRPEALTLTADATAEIHGQVTDIAFLGAAVVYRVDIGGAEIRVHEAGSDVVAPRFVVGDAVGVTVDFERSLFLSSDATHPRLSTSAGSSV